MPRLRYIEEAEKTPYTRELINLPNAPERPTRGWSAS